MAVVIKCHKLSGLKKKRREVLSHSLEAASPASGDQLAWFFLLAMRRNLFHAPRPPPTPPSTSGVCWQWVTFVGLQNHHPDHCLHLHTVFSLYMWLSRSPLVIRIPVILGQGPPYSNTTSS